MRVARIVFRIAGVYGLLVLLPQYFLEAKTSADYPPAITHPEYFYGFIGVALAWQVAFLVIASDPARYRPLMWAGILEKLAFGIAGPVLVGLGRTPGIVAAFAGIDLLLAALFVWAWCATPAYAVASTK